jgi:hypothetical protein
MLRTIAAWVLACSLTLVIPRAAAAQDDEVVTAEDALTLAVGGAALSAGVAAFDAMLVVDFDDGTFGPTPLLDVSLTLSIVGAFGAHASALALLDGHLRRDPLARAVLAGVSMLSLGLSLVSFALPTGWALTSDPPSGQEAIALVAPYLLGAMGLVALGGGVALIADAGRTPAISIAPTAGGASLVIGGRF